MNSIPKYVASRTLESAKWNATVIKGNLVEEIVKIKHQPGQDILKYGTGILDRELIEHSLIDLFHIYLFPFVFGHGIRFFEDIRASRHLKLEEVTTFKSVFWNARIRAFHSGICFREDFIGLATE